MKEPPRIAPHSKEVKNLQIACRPREDETVNLLPQSYKCSFKSHFLKIAKYNADPRIRDKCFKSIHYNFI